MARASAQQDADVELPAGEVWSWCAVLVCCWMKLVPAWSWLLGLGLEETWGVATWSLLAG